LVEQPAPQLAALLIPSFFPLYEHNEVSIKQILM
jgi:hypothetical protein